MQSSTGVPLRARHLLHTEPAVPSLLQLRLGCTLTATLALTRASFTVARVRGLPLRHEHLLSARYCGEFQQRRMCARPPASSTHIEFKSLPVKSSGGASDAPPLFKMVSGAATLLRVLLCCPEAQATMHRAQIRAGSPTLVQVRPWCVWRTQAGLRCTACVRCIWGGMVDGV